MKKINKEELHTLFEKIKSNDRVAYDTFYEKYKSLVYGISFTICKSHEIADEVTQNVFFKIWKLSEEKFPTSYEASWLYTITKNETIDVLRKSFNYTDIDSIYNVQDYNNDIDDVVNADNFNTMISSLKEDEKQIISLKVISDFTFKEIGILLNIPTATAQWKYYKSIKSLRLVVANLAMFVLTFALYLRTKISQNQNINQAKHEININESFQSGESSKNIDNSFNPSTIIDSIDSKSDSNYQSTQGVSTSSIVNSSTILLGVSSIFLILILVFAIFVKKHQQKIKSKSFKLYTGKK